MTHLTSPGLPRSLAPLHEESLVGFLLRLAHRLERSPWRVADLCGLGSRRTSIGYGYLRDLPDEVAVRFSHAARLSSQEVDALTMRRFASSYPLLQRVRTDAAVTGRRALVNWAMNPSSRFCPACLRGDGSPVQAAFGGAWKTRWHLPVVFACPQHHSLLRSVCPSCSNPVNTKGSGGIGLIKRPRLAGLHPLQCRHILVADQIRKRTFRAEAACGARLDENPDRDSALGSEDLDRLLALQQRLDQLLTATDQPVGDCQPADPSFFPDPVMATHLIKLSWPAGASLLPSAALTALVDEHCAPITELATTQRGASADSRHIETRPAPTDSAQCGALLLAAHNLLGDRDLTSLHERVQPLAREAYGRHPLCQPWVRRPALSG
ncbi:TniQ family protein [Kitasatospora hibisci]|uniref:TniQ family protein n=1 Tax=Kitasatospora hibisci TaxID=3369522 RepID=UPI003754D1DA